jgi:hypothetical protein
MCQELDHCLRYEKGSFSDGQIKAALVNSLPKEYQQFKIARDLTPSSEQDTIESLSTKITNHYTNYVQAKVENDEKANKARSAKGKGKGKGKKGKNGKGRNKGKTGDDDTEKGNRTQPTEHGKHGNRDNANATNNSLRDCILCRQLSQEEQPQDLKHTFEDCPNLKNFKDAASSKTKAGRSVHDDDDRPESSKRQSGRKATYRDIE